MLAGTEAQLYVSDIRRACAYYVDRLGFTVDFAYGDPPFYALVKRDRAHLCLRLVCEPVFVGDIREREQLLSASLTVNAAQDIATLHREFQAAGADVFQALRTEPWGAQTFVIRDLDGNLVLFAGPR